jgi:hypothetical protein
LVFDRWQVRPTGHSRSSAGIDLGLLHPAAQRIPVDTQLLPDPATSTGHRQLQLIIGQKIIDLPPASSENQTER